MARRAYSMLLHRHIPFGCAAALAVAGDWALWLHYGRLHYRGRSLPRSLARGPGRDIVNLPTHTTARPGGAVTQVVSDDEGHLRPYSRDSARATSSSDNGRRSDAAGGYRAQIGGDPFSSEQRQLLQSKVQKLDKANSHRVQGEDGPAHRRRAGGQPDITGSTTGLASATGSMRRLADRLTGSGGPSSWPAAPSASPWLSVGRSRPRAAETFSKLRRGSARQDAGSQPPSGGSSI